MIRGPITNMAANKSDLELMRQSSARNAEKKSVSAESKDAKRGNETAK